jgi:hypothetical protein
MALGSIIVPLHVNCRASSVNVGMPEKTMMSDACSDETELGAQHNPATLNVI